VSSREELYRRVCKWESRTRDVRDAHPYRIILEEVLFHSIRYADYSPYQEEGLFVQRFHDWLNNVPEPQQKMLLRLAQYLIFIDRQQMMSLYKDAFRRVITGWLAKRMSAADWLSPQFNMLIRNALMSCKLFAVTESFQLAEFVDCNSLAGLERPDILGFAPENLEARLGPGARQWRRVIVFEDFVGTGRHTLRMLKALGAVLPEADILFVPMIALEDGAITLRRKLSSVAIAVDPVLMVPSADCVLPSAQQNEPRDFADFRSLIRQTERVVLERLNAIDDPPASPFGYQGSGSLVVTFHNSPNNTLGLIHHKAPHWSALFRRVVHAKQA